MLYHKLLIFALLSTYTLAQATEPMLTLGTWINHYPAKIDIFVNDNAQAAGFLDGNGAQKNLNIGIPLLPAAQNHAIGSVIFKEGNQKQLSLKADYDKTTKSLSVDFKWHHDPSVSSGEIEKKEMVVTDETTTHFTIDGQIAVSGGGSNAYVISSSSMNITKSGLSKIT